MRVLLVCWSLLLMGLPVTVSAERSQDFGDYVVHFNALGTRLLPPEVTSAYNIQRSPYQGLLNVAVLRRVLGTTGEPVIAEVSGTITNLTGQQSRVSPREIREGTAIYYIDTFRINHEDMLDFDLSVRPQGETQPLQVRFRQQFFID